MNDIPIDLWLNFSSALIGAVVGGLFMLWGIRIQAARQEKRDLIEKTQAKDNLMAEFRTNLRWLKYATAQLEDQFEAILRKANRFHPILPCNRAVYDYEKSWVFELLGGRLETLNGIETVYGIISVIFDFLDNFERVHYSRTEYFDRQSRHFGATDNPRVSMHEIIDNIDNEIYRKHLITYTNQISILHSNSLLGQYYLEALLDPENYHSPTDEFLMKIREQSRAALQKRIDETISYFYERGIKEEKEFIEKYAKIPNIENIMNS